MFQLFKNNAEISIPSFFVLGDFCPLNAVKTRNHHKTVKNISTAS